jgi:hypothetical protein
MRNADVQIGERIVTGVGLRRVRGRRYAIELGNVGEVVEVLDQGADGAIVARGGREFVAVTIGLSTPKPTAIRGPFPGVVLQVDYPEPCGRIRMIDVANHGGMLHVKQSEFGRPEITVADGVTEAEVTASPYRFISWYDVRNAQPEALVAGWVRDHNERLAVQDAGEGNE